MPPKHQAKILSALAIGLLAAVAAVPAHAFDKVATADHETVTAPSDSGACANPKACIVAGAEVDDEATIKARAQAGTGPASGYASDRRIKTEITELGKLDNGIKIYAFKFLWEDKVRVGVIAQDLLERADTKKAVLTLANGLMGVDYTALGLRMATLEQWQQSGIAAMKADYKPAAKRTAKLDDPVRLFNKRPAY